MMTDLKILLVDDHEINNLFTGYLFSKLGIPFDIAVNKDQAIELLSENEYSMVLMDIEMPRYNGYEVAKMLRDINHKIPIVAFTTLPAKEVLPKAFEVGMNDYMLKPNAMQELEDMLDRYKQSA